MIPFLQLGGRNTDGPQFSIHSEYYRLAFENCRHRLPEMMIDAGFLGPLIELTQAGHGHKKLFAAAESRLPPASTWPELRQACTYFGEEYDPRHVFLVTLIYVASRMAEYDRAAPTERLLKFIVLQTCEDKWTCATHRGMSGVAYPVADPGFRVVATVPVWGCRCSTVRLSQSMLDRDAYQKADFPFDIYAYCNPV